MYAEIRHPWDREQPVQIEEELRSIKKYSF
jgi:hypothetical protein